MNRSRAVLVLFAMFPLLVSGTRREERPSIVLVSVDTLRADHLGVYGGQERPERTASRWSLCKAKLPLGGRTVTLDVQQVRAQDGGEVTLTSVARLQRRDVLVEWVIKQILSNVSTRGYEGTLQVAPCGVKTAGASRSAVTRRFVAATQARVEAALSRSVGHSEMTALVAALARLRPASNASATVAA